MAPTLLQRFEGTMVGVLAGDAAGAPFETKHASYIQQALREDGGLALHDYIEPFKGKRRISAGQPTDDSELTAALAQSLAKGEFDPSDLYLRLRGFIHGVGGELRKSILTSDKAYGSGGTLRSALRAPTYMDSFPLFREGRVRVAPTNGSLMRCAPVALRYFNEKWKAALIARLQSCVTHVHPAAQVACLVYTLMLRNLLECMDVKVAYSRVLEDVKSLYDTNMSSPDKVLSADLKRWVEYEIEPVSEEELWPNIGDVNVSLRVALWALQEATDVRDGLTKAISVGGDTDTYAAIAGGLLGARFGIEGIPQEWRDVLKGREMMEQLARRLYDLCGAER